MASVTTISIALATYNGERYLAEQLDSLEAQTRKPDELVVCDDQSTDATLDILARFAETASFPVRVHRNAERLGWRGNFVKASGLCSSELIAFCDQDDIWYPEKLAVVEAEFGDPEVLLVYHNADLCRVDRAIYSTLLPLVSKKERIPRLSRPTHWGNPFGLTITFRGILTRYNHLWPDSVDTTTPVHHAAHDQWFYYLATNLGDVIALPERLLAYRQHADNVVGFERVNIKTRLRLDPDAIHREIDLPYSMLKAFGRILRLAAITENTYVKIPLAEAATANERLSNQLANRQLLYKSATFKTRARCFAQLALHRSYSQSRRWGLGRRAFIADVFFVMLGDAHV